MKFVALFSIFVCLAQGVWANNYIYEKPKTLPKLAIIIDDIGYNIAQGKRAVAIKAAITLSVLPHTPGSATLATEGHLSGKQIMLHAPMSNLAHKKLGPGALKVGMEKTQFLQILRDDIDAIPYVSGVNNHMGSELTSMQEPMQWLMQELKQRQLFFIDSLTSGKSVALKVARQHGVISAKRDIFLDNEQDEAKIEKQLLSAIALAKHQGYAIAIGHPYAATMTVLEKYASQFIKHGVLLVSVSDILLINTNSYNYNLKNK